MVTFSEKNRWEFPLVSTACPNAKLNEYFGELQNSEIESPQTQGDFGCNIYPFGKLPKRKSTISKKNGKFGIGNSRNKDVIQHTLLRLVNTISGCSGGEKWPVDLM